MLRPALIALCAATIATGATAHSTGVAICDEFLKALEDCLSGSDPRVRALDKPAYDYHRELFRDIAKTPDGKKGLAEGTCKEGLDMIKAHSRSNGCKKF